MEAAGEEGKNEGIPCVGIGCIMYVDVTDCDRPYQ